MNATPPELVLFVCTANQCRSPMAEVLLRRALGAGTGIEVSSAGVYADGTPPPEPAVEVMAARGLDVAGRPGQRLDAALLDRSSLVVTMAREHLLAVATISPPALERAFTLTDLLDRAGRAGGRLPTETVGQWARRLSGGRTTSAVMALPPSADVPDPIGHSMRRYESVADLLETSTARLAALLTSSEPPAGSPGGGGQEGGRARRRWLGRR